MYVALSVFFLVVFVLAAVGAFILWSKVAQALVKEGRDLPLDELVMALAFVFVVLGAQILFTGAAFYIWRLL